VAASIRKGHFVGLSTVWGLIQAIEGILSRQGKCVNNCGDQTIIDLPLQYQLGEIPNKSNPTKRRLKHYWPSGTQAFKSKRQREELDNT
jgi:hypothetical protein